MKRYSRLIALLLGVSLIIGGCTTPKVMTTIDLTTPKVMTTKDLVAEANEHVTNVPVSVAKELLDEGGYIFLDVRTAKEFKMGHIPGAVHIERGLLEFMINNQVPYKNAQIVVYCKVGGRGSLAAHTLIRMGYKNVKNIEGGWVPWEKAGYPVE
ncbi:MAG: rhodanese-like domain-containing protein [Desulfobacterales bacterium]|nr:rhodanese-like domain-containing protein [Desulfobacterales bacterium]